MASATGRLKFCTSGKERGVVLVKKRSKIWGMVAVGKEACWHMAAFCDCALGSEQLTPQQCRKMAAAPEVNLVPLSLREGGGAASHLADVLCPLFFMKIMPLLL